MISRKFPDINYIWVGSPQEHKIEKEGMTAIKHDIDTPIQMSKQNKSNPIKFWCLDKYCAHYKQALKEYKNIEVCSIEEYLKSEVIHSKNPKLALEVLMKFNYFLSKPGDKIRDRVTAKELISLSIITSKGGFVLDSNVKPLKEKKEVALTDMPYFQAPRIYRPHEFYQYLTECWMMYAPSNNEMAQNILVTFLKNITMIERIQEIQGYSPTYHHFLGWNIIRSIENHFDIRLSSTHWIIKDNDKYAMPKLNLQKQYFNTHRKELKNRESHDELYLYTLYKDANNFIKTDDAENLKRLIDQNKLNVDCAIETRQSLIFAALKSGALKCIDLLESHNAQVSAYELDDILHSILLTEHRDNNSYLRGINTIIHILDKYHIDINRQIDKKSLLEHAVAQNKTAVANILIQRGAKIPEDLLDKTPYYALIDNKIVYKPGVRLYTPDVTGEDNFVKDEISLHASIKSEKRKDYPSRSSLFSVKEPSKVKVTSLELGRNTPY